MPTVVGQTTGRLAHERLSQGQQWVGKPLEQIKTQVATRYGRLSDDTIRTSTDVLPAPPQPREPLWSSAAWTNDSEPLVGRGANPRAGA